MKIKVADLSAAKEVEVTLPLYRKHNLDSSAIYTRVYEQRTLSGNVGVAVSIQVYDDKNRIELAIEHHRGCFNPRDGEDYNTGKGEYASSRAEFESALREARILLDKIERSV